MKYDSHKRTLLLEVDKSALEDEREKANINTVLIRSAVPLEESLFIYDFKDIKTTSDQANLIFTYL